MARILIFDHDKEEAKTIKDSLEFEGFETVFALNGKDGQNRAINESFDSIILDSEINDLNWMELLKEMRKASKEVPILIISNKRNDQDIVFSLNLGADDYLARPFSTVELVARIRAHIRRINLIKGSQFNSGSYPGYEPITIKIGESLVYLDKMIVRTGEEEHPLTPKEIGIIRLLYKNRGKVVPRDMMMKEIWGDDIYITERVIDTNVVSIRKKIGDLGRKAKFIKTVFGVGYKMIEY
jgi:DNA-binding response OmpR family regulator